MLAWLVAVAIFGWVALLVAAPVLPGWIGAVLYGLGSVICHQIPDRSFHVATFQLPVCARCFGLYFGASIGAIGGLRVTPDTRLVRRLAALAAIPTALTVLLEAAGVWNPANLSRAVAGMPLGAVVGIVVVNALATVHYGECAPPRPIAPKPPPPSI